MKYIVILLLSFLSLNIFGQIKKDTTEVEELNIGIIETSGISGKFKADLKQSKKLESNPILPNSTQNQPLKLNYDVPTYLLSMEYPAPSIRALTVKPTKKANHYGFYAEAAFGFPLSPLLELSYHNKNTDRLKFGATVKHQSLLGGYLENQRYSKTGLDLNTTYYMNNGLALGGEILFNYNTNRFYGNVDSFFTDAILADTALLSEMHISEDSLKQAFVDFEMNLNVFNSQLSRNHFNYRGDLNFYVYNDRYGSSEFALAPKVMVDKWFGRDRMHQLKANIGLNFTNFSMEDSSLNRLVFYFQPSFNLNAGAFKAKLGVDLGMNTGNFYVLPDVELSYSIAKGSFVPYVGAEGAIREHTFRNLTRLNPFLVSNPELRNTNYMEFFGGLRGTIKGISYDFRGGYARANDQAYFLNDSMSNYHKFSVVYDSVGIIFFRGMLDFEIIKNLHLGGIVDFNIYQTNAYEKAYHLPTWQSNAFLIYNMYFNKKSKERSWLRLKTEFFVNAGVPYFNPKTNTAEVLNGLFDFNFEATYHISPNFAVFTQLNNLIHNQNQRWYGYRQLGFNALIGAKMKF